MACTVLMAAGAMASSAFWDHSLVSVEISRKHYDYLQPWAPRIETVQKSAVVAGPHQVVTTAEYLNSATLIRLQKGGRGKWYDARVDWIDYHANLALLTSADTNFWAGLEAAFISDRLPEEGAVQIMRWRAGNREARKGEMSRVSVKRGKLTFLELLHFTLDSDIDGAGWSEPVVMDKMLYGLTASQEGKTISVVPAPFIRMVLEGLQKRNYRGLGFFDFVWQSSENPATLAYLKVPGEPRGVVVSDFITSQGTNALLRPHDVILQIGAFPIANDGNYKDPQFENLSLEYLATRFKWAGDEVLLKIWREGQPRDIVYPLPKADYSVELVPKGESERPPEYLIVGGLVFQPLTRAYLENWGPEWRRKAPYRLTYYEQERPTLTHPTRVLLSLVLPDPYNLGYQDYRFMVVNKVNGQPVARLQQVLDALGKDQNGFHTIEFGAGEMVHRVVLSSEQLQAATQRVLQRYGIEKDRVLAAP